MRVLAAAVVVEHSNASCADGGVGEAFAPGPPEGVGDNDAESYAASAAERRTQRPRTSVGVDGQEEHSARGGVGRVDAGCRHD